MDATASSSIQANTATLDPGAPSNGQFVLAWQDDFDKFDSSLWQLMTHSWDGNLAQFSTPNAHVANGVISIELKPEPNNKTKPYSGVELRSIRTIIYGKVEARIRFARGSGVVSSLVAIYTPWPADDWNEIDFEHLGIGRNVLQTSCQVYTGPVMQKPVQKAVTPNRFEQKHRLDFNMEKDFHIYSMEWMPTGVSFLVDGKLIRTWDKEISRMRLPQNILFTIWASGSAGWAGRINDSSVPTSAEMDWIKVYEYRRQQETKVQ